MAQPAPAQQLTYAAYADGLDVMDMAASLTIAPDRYWLKLSFHLTGLLGALVSMQSTTTVDGRFHGDAPEPRESFSTGRFRGQDRVTQLDWQNGRPVVSQLVPPVEPERDPVPADEQAHTVDTLSAMASLLHQVGASGHCDGTMITFDGRRLSSLAAHTVGEEVLPKTGRSVFAGPALRCDIEGRQLAGFFHDSDTVALHRPQHGSAWFASLEPGAPPVPVKIMLQTYGLGQATIYLTGQTKSPPNAAPAAPAG